MASPGGDDLRGQSAGGAHDGSAGKADETAAHRQKRYRSNLQAEIDSAAVYRAMQSAEPDEHLASIYGRLAEVEERHRDFWEGQLRALGADSGAGGPSWRARVMARLARAFGPRLVLPTVATFERVDQAMYDDQPETAGAGMREQERSHARVLRYLMSGSPKGVAGETLGRLEGRHRAVGGNTLRAAVLGANDGLTSNLALVMGVAGANLATKSILITGISGLLAGACSMAIGEWISAQSARELYERQVKTEEAELYQVPDEEEEELALIYEAKGLAQSEAEKVANELISDHQAALDAMTREELGLDPAQLRGSPNTAASSSFILFALGAVVPLIPYFAGVTRWVAVLTAAACAAVALLAMGALITLLTGRSVLFSGVRQLVFGLTAAGVTFGLARLASLVIR